MNFIGIDIGTSAVKAVLVDHAQRMVAEATLPLSIARPRPGWFEQNPDDWWNAVATAVSRLRRDAPSNFAAVGGIGLSGQMHGLVVVDAGDRPLRPAMLWNDGRAGAECIELEAAVPGLDHIAGIGAMPGFTAPKLLWLRRHEPELFAHIARVLLAKDYVRLRLTGEAATDMADAAGTLLLDEAARDWSDPVLAAVGLSRLRLPRLCEGNEPAGMVRPEIADGWGLARTVVVAAGAGDAAAGAVGIGAIEDGDGFLSLGTSAQIFRTRAVYEPKPERLIHAFAHALPNRWFEMAALLNGAACLDWVARLLGETDVAGLLARVEARGDQLSPVTFLPYLAGERTPLGDVDARGALADLSYATGGEDLVRAVLDGVVMALMDGQLAFGDGLGGRPIPIVGGGARSRFWTKLIASGLDRPLQRVASGEIGPAFGAARLARLAVTGEDVADVCAKPAVLETVSPDPALAAAYARRLAKLRDLYRELKAVRPVP